MHESFPTRSSSEQAQHASLSQFTAQVMREQQGAFQRVRRVGLGRDCKTSSRKHLRPLHIQRVLRADEIQDNCRT
jgi:hypothetical protein